MQTASNSKLLKAGVKLSFTDSRDYLLDLVIHEFYDNFPENENHNKKRGFLMNNHSNVDIVDVLFNDQKKQTSLQINVPDQSLLNTSNDENTTRQSQVWQNYLVTNQKQNAMRDPIDVIDQGFTSICVCASGVTMKHFQEIDSTNRETLNPYFLYNCRSFQSRDEGMSVRNMLTILYKYGCPSVSTFPYKHVSTSKNGKPKIQVESQVFASAAKHKIAGYGRIYSLSTLLDAIDLNKSSKYKNQFGAFLLVLPIYNSSMLYWMPSSTKSGSSQMYQCTSIIDYDIDLQVLKVQNSWSNTWGHNGCFYFPFSHWLPCVAECWFSTNSPEFASTLKQKLLDRKNIANFENYHNGDLEIDNKKQPPETITNTEFLNVQFQDQQKQEQPKPSSSSITTGFVQKLKPLLNKLKIQSKNKQK